MESPILIGLNINNYIFACLANKSKTLLITEEREPYFYDSPKSSCEAYSRAKLNYLSGDLRSGRNHCDWYECSLRLRDSEPYEHCCGYPCCGCPCGPCRSLLLRLCLTLEQDCASQRERVRTCACEHSVSHEPCCDRPCKLRIPSDVHGRNGLCHNESKLRMSNRQPSMPRGDRSGSVLHTCHTATESARSGGLRYDDPLEVLEKAPYITVSFTRPDGTPYGVPLSLAHTDENTFYFHCAMEGEKLDCIAANPMVALPAVWNARLW